MQVGFPVKGGSNLFQILDMGLDEYVAKFEKISEAATKEFNLECSMQQMVDDWADMEFIITPYGDTGTYTLSSMDSIQVKVRIEAVQVFPHLPSPPQKKLFKVYENEQSHTRQMPSISTHAYLNSFYEFYGECKL